MKHLVAGLALLAAGCPDRTIATVAPVPAAVALKDIPVSADVDILFVIDNSASTRDKQGCTVRHGELLSDPAGYARFLSTLNGPSGVAVALIAGDPAADITIGPLAATPDGPFSVDRN